VFRGFGVNKNTGVFAGMSMPFGESASMEPRSNGWRARESEGASFYREASLSYRSSIGTVLGGASQDRSGSRATLELRGSITTMDGGRLSVELDQRWICGRQRRHAWARSAA
jgi:outer membrane usher protein